MAFSSIREKRDFEEQGDTHATLIKKAFLIRHILVIILLITDFQYSKCGWVICNRLIFNFILWYYSLQLYFSISWSWDGQLVAQSKLRACIKINTFSYHMLWTGSPVFGAKDCWIHPWYHYTYTIIGLATPDPIACDLGELLSLWTLRSEDGNDGEKFITLQTSSPLI